MMVWTFIGKSCGDRESACANYDTGEVNVETEDCQVRLFVSFKTGESPHDFFIRARSVVRAAGFDFRSENDTQ